MDAKERTGAAWRVVSIEAAAVAALEARIDDHFAAAARHMLDCRGRVVVTGMGKSGHIAGKIAATLADLYDPLTMPPALLKAHRTLDKAVDAAYTRRKFTGDAERVAFLFEQYQTLTRLLPAEKRGGTRRKE